MLPAHRCDGIRTRPLSQSARSCKFAEDPPRLIGTGESAPRSERRPPSSQRRYFPKHFERLSLNWLLQSAIEKVARQAKSRALGRGRVWRHGGDAAALARRPTRRCREHEEIATSATIGTERSAEPRPLLAAREGRPSPAETRCTSERLAEELCAGAVGRRHSRIVMAVQQAVDQAPRLWFCLPIWSTVCFPPS